jgi:hypothetical protein
MGALVNTLLGSSSKTQEQLREVCGRAAARGRSAGRPARASAPLHEPSDARARAAAAGGPVRRAAGPSGGHHPGGSSARRSRGPRLPPGRRTHARAGERDRRGPGLPCGHARLPPEPAGGAASAPLSSPPPPPLSHTHTRRATQWMRSCTQDLRRACPAWRSLSRSTARRVAGRAQGRRPPAAGRLLLLQPARCSSSSSSSSPPQPPQRPERGAMLRLPALTAAACRLRRADRGPPPR